MVVLRQRRLDLYVDFGAAVTLSKANWYLIQLALAPRTNAITCDTIRRPVARKVPLQSRGIHSRPANPWWCDKRIIGVTLHRP
jgi:hypothetical protein